MFAKRQGCEEAEDYFVGMRSFCDQAMDDRDGSPWSAAIAAANDRAMGSTALHEFAHLLNDIVIDVESLLDTTDEAEFVSLVTLLGLARADDDGGRVVKSRNER